MNTRAKLERAFERATKAKDEMDDALSNLEEVLGYQIDDLYEKLDRGYDLESLISLGGIRDDKPS
jgi:hypothetical protein